MEQEIIIFVDDSGKLSKKENCCVYGGLIFLSSKEKNKFINSYRAVINDIRQSYLSINAVELKSNMIKPSHRRRLINLCKKHKTFALIINNSKVYDNIMNQKASRGRYIDYVQKIIFISLIKKLIKNHIIDSNLPVKININIDQQTTKSNGYYTLKNGLYEELVHGYHNYNYNFTHASTLKSNLTLSINYVESKKSICIQAADIVAGTIRQYYLGHIDPNIRHNKIKSITWHYMVKP